MKISFPTLSARELELWVATLSKQVVDSRVMRVFVPSCPAHPEGYYKKEWAFELHHPSRGGSQFYFNVRSQECGFLVVPSKTFKAAGTATRSGFDLSLAKAIEGKRVLSLTAIKNERAVRIDFGNTLEASLYLLLIPSQPEAVLVLESGFAGSSKVRETFTPPTERVLSIEAIEKIPLRRERIEPAHDVARRWLNLRETEALELRKKKVREQLELEIDSIKRKIDSLSEQLTQTQAEPDWKHFGSLLQAHFHTKPQPKVTPAGATVFTLQDFETAQRVELPADPKLNLKAQLERYFHLAKRKKARLQDSQERIEVLKARLPALLARSAQVESTPSLESLLELVPGARSLTTLPKSTDQKKIAAFTGHTYISREGLTVVSGRNIKENLEVTFKIARGNDLWLHVKGRPGSHTVILLPPKKTASLETLLDAATLCLLHSGGKDWGKTEVDYTQRKYVKKIKNQTEVTYTHNKTLSVAVEPERAKRLLDYFSQKR